MVTAVVGAGGKTTLIHTLAARYRAAGRRVLVTTSTHMYREPQMLLDPDAAALIAALRHNGYAAAGSAAPEGKFGPLPPAVYRAGCAAADEVLVEADGAKGRLLKLPAAHEPVIPDNAARIILVCNLKAAGLRLAEAAHRPAPLRELLHAQDDTVLTPQMVQAAAERYVALLRARWPEKQLLLRVNHDGTPAQAALARTMEQRHNGTHTV